MKNYDLSVLFKQSDIEVLERTLSSTAKGLPLSFYELFYKILDTKEITLDELDRLVIFAYDSWNDQQFLYFAANSIYKYISRNFGCEYEDRTDYGSVIDGRVYKEGEYRCLTWLDINHDRRDGKVQIAIVDVKEEVMNQKGYMTHGRLNKIVNYYYGADNVSTIEKQKTKAGRPPVYTVCLKNGKRYKLTKEDLLQMERING